MAKYSPTPLAELVDESDLIFHGVIVSVQEKSITVKPLNVVKGARPEATITLDKFEDWTCASRFTSYKVGQQEFLFLRKSKTTGVYFPLGSGNEGEIPVLNQKVYYRNPNPNDTKDLHTFSVYGGTVLGHVYSYNGFVDAIKFYMANRAAMTAAITSDKLRGELAQSPALRRIYTELHYYRPNRLY
ncbi:hypothetical protein SAMN04515668_0446 [Hymenobacter arizonensis]|uniref:Uncharacterized protein n=2 Tax=Hymenobacter arizonensis TaxID=1227077 RepID=A0A1I5TEW1_HYMAR|nr:hypothetical protein SAMN04515668_0446 [Hymenobacter arizonensis]